MRKTRGAMAFELGAKEVSDLPEVQAEDRPVGGNWSRIAFRELESQVDEARETIATANRMQVQGILEGSVPIHIPADQITDIVESDRLLSESNDPEGLKDLVENIRERGLRTPLRVRPVDPSWRPDPADPRNIEGQIFALQSGRRRLAACNELGIVPLCFLSFVEKQRGRLDDLQERFFENVMRKDLTTVERLYSVGLIAKETEGTTQQQIGEIVGVSAANISRGLAVMEHFGELKTRLGEQRLARATRREIDEALKAIRAGIAKSENPEAVRSRNRVEAKTHALPFRQKELPIGQVKLRETREGRRIFTIDSSQLDDQRIAKLMEIIERL